ncbi:TPA: helix-turn-helix transcriptional regulator [Candidatus Scatousia excrementigallinarum]|uniref:Helix-turn-helix transcriptional regulator n=1 Tax=Candidatus Scatousia excrementigallinarum TaxID=2840935 RepID=A0A9D1EYU5_9BACT|nr:helix-turn-helix transcriptional regulator [Candidatus Scatousia excrementigallinarum]
MNVVQKIRQLQNERNWTDYRLAQEANISQSSLATLFSRQTPPKLEMLQSICNAFGLTLSQFFLENENIEILSDTEKKMLQVFRKLSPKQQKALIDVFEE